MDWTQAAKSLRSSLGPEQKLEFRPVSIFSRSRLVERLSAALKAEDPCFGERIPRRSMAKRVCPQERRPAAFEESRPRLLGSSRRHANLSESRSAICDPYLDPYFFGTQVFGAVPAHSFLASGVSMPPGSQLGSKDASQAGL